jgi:2-polyprenyl-3-methyl-5-hydroxy-6-metoxy-1,4-benzoquinol methylase
MAELPPSTSEQIAGAAGLQERYVREWLGAMVTGGIVDYFPADALYHLPREHARSLARAASPDNIASFTQYVAMLGNVEDEIVECFSKGGGVAYSAYPRFHEVMAEDSGQTVVAALNEAILPVVPGLVVSLQKGIAVLDVGCGSGRAVTTMASAFPESKFAGYDFSGEAIAAARDEAARLGLPNVRFEVRHATALGDPEEYDLITAFDAIHDQAKPAEVLREISNSLRPRGTFLMQDIRSSTAVEKNIDHPVGPFLYTISCMHCMTVSLAQDGLGLGTMWGEELALEMLEAAGFTEVVVRQLPHDFQNTYFIAKKG